MSETNKLNSLAKYKNIFGDTKETIKAIQNFIKSSQHKVEDNDQIAEDEPAASINRVLNSRVDDTSVDIQKIINNL